MVLLCYWYRPNDRDRIYLKAYIAGGTILDEGLHALMFFLLGLFFTLMYGENKQAPEDKAS